MMIQVEKTSYRTLDQNFAVLLLENLSKLLICCFAFNDLVKIRAAGVGENGSGMCYKKRIRIFECIES
jgi:hypothetical protein